MIPMLESLTNLMQQNALISIIILSFVLSMIVTLIYKFLTNQALMKELKTEMKKMQGQMKAEKDPKKLSEIQKKSMSLNMKLMKQSFKPMLITILPFFAIFAWLRSVYGDITVITLPFWPHTLGWIGTYIIFSLIFSTVLRKLLKVV
jgi:uncharacterized membrane protein (DUF106 family)